MIGSVDDDNRALLPVEVRSKIKNKPCVVQAWVDTAFDGHFVFSSKLIDELGLETLVETEAILADGTNVILETYVAYLDWFGRFDPSSDRRERRTVPIAGDRAA